MNSGLRAIAFALVLTSGAVYARLDVKIDPNPLMVGEIGHYEIISDEDKPKVDRLPHVSNVQWVGAPSEREEVRIVNFRQTRSFSVSFPFLAQQPGHLEFPSFLLKVGKRRLSTPRTTCEVKPATVRAPGTTRQVRLGDLAFVKVQVGTGPKPPAHVYVGQEIPLEIRVYAYERLLSGLRYPQVQIENASFRDFSAQNRENAKFLPPNQHREIKNGLPLTVILFQCRITPLAAGALSGSGVVPLSLIDPRQSRSRRRTDPFGLFNDPFSPFRTNRTIPRRLSFSIPQIPVLTPPPVPANAGVFLGLIGDWKMAVRTDAAKVRVGEPVALELTVSGRGGIDALAPPKLDPPGFRTHEPEVKKNATGTQVSATLTWALIPLEPDATLPPLVFSTFDPRKGEYHPQTFRIPLQVKPAPVTSTSANVVDDSGKPTGKTALPTAKHPQEATDIFYIKTELGSYVRRPLWRNTLVPGLVLVLVGMAFYLGCLGLAVHRERLRGSGGYRRRREALARRSQVLRELRICRDGCEAVICEQLVPYLSALCDLPPGTTPGALANHLRSQDAEVADMLLRAEQGSYMPEAAGGIDPRTLIRRLRRLGFFVFAAGLTLFAAGFSPNTWADDSPAADGQACSIKKATQAYEEGRVDEARTMYRGLERTGEANAALLYNLGNCAYRTGRLGEAAAYYEEARRLAPRDTQILENLNFVRSRLGLAPLRQVRNPAELLTFARDDLRPDEWGLLAAIFLFFAGVWAGIQRLRRRAAAAGLIVLAAGVSICLLALWSQLQSTYRPGVHGIVLNTRASPHLLPNDDADKAKFALKPGEAVWIEEERTHWYRIRVGESEAWVEKSPVRRVW